MRESIFTYLINPTCIFMYFYYSFFQVAIEHAWYAYGLRYHSIHFALYISLLIINSACNYLFMQMSGNNDFGLVYINLVIVGFFCLYEVLQFFQDPIEYFTSFSNMFDLTAFVLLIAGNGLRLQNQTESDDSAALLAVGTVMLYGDFLFFLRPFKATGALIGMIEAIFWGIRYYLFILGIVLYGFSQALFILSYQNVNVTDDAIPGLEFTTPGTALLHAYTYMLGASSYPPNLTISNPPLATFLIAMLIFVTAIVLLNLLISLMSYIFGGVQDSADEEWRKKVCTTILDQFRIFKPRVQQYTHYLKRVQDTKKEKAEVKIESVLSELRDQFYPAIMNFDDHRHELYRMTRDESGYLKIVCDVCKLEVTGDGHDLLYNCKSCVYSTHLHCALPMIASDAKVQKLSATVNLKLKNVLSELRDQNYPATMCCSSHDITHTLTRSLIRTSTYNPMFCGLCHRSVNPHDDDDMFYECTESDCAFHGHMKCCVDSNQKGETRIVALEAKLDLILEKLNKRTYH